MPGGTCLDLRHDGYQERYGLLHTRTLTLSDDGRQLHGVDALLRTGRPTRNDRYAVRFHLHPEVRTSFNANDGRVLLDTRTERWRFTSVDAPISMEDSIYFAGPHGPRSTAQIVIHTSTAQAMQLAWTFERLDG